MRKLFFSIFVLFTTIYISSSSGSLPDWVLYELDKYPSETYLFDVGKSDEAGERGFEIAAARAYENTAKRVLGEANSIVRLNEGELQHGMVLEHYSSVLEDYYTSRQKSPALKLDKEEFSVRNLSVDLARADPHTYTLVYITREKLEEVYANRVASLRQRIKYRLNTAKAAEENLDIKSAVKTYLQTYPLYEELKEAEIIQIAAKYGHTSDFSDAFDELANDATYTSGDLWTHRQVIKHVKALEPQTIVSLDDIAGVIKSQFLPQHGAFSNKVSIRPLTCDDLETACSFTQEFKEALEKKFGWVNDSFSSQRLSSSSWKNGAEITIRTTLRDVNTGEFLASAIVQFLNSQLRVPLPDKPSNHEQARIEKRAFTPRYYEMRRVRRNPENSTSEELVEHQFSPVGGLEVEVWTDKGRSLMHYTKDETMKVFGSVNQPAYLRLIYILADGKRTLLQDNHYIGSSNVNSNVEIGEFVCTPPFGVEMLVVAARTKPFPPIDTYEKNGYTFLTDQDAESASRSFRGMQRIQNKNSEEKSSASNQNGADQAPRFQQSEAQLVITTMEK